MVHIPQTGEPVALYGALGNMLGIVRWTGMSYVILFNRINNPAISYMLEETRTVIVFPTTLHLVEAI